MSTRDRGTTRRRRGRAVAALAACAIASAVASACPPDLDESGDVGFGDLLDVLATWGECPPGPCPQDLDANGVVGFNDLLIVLAQWGPCPLAPNEAELVGLPSAFDPMATYVQTFNAGDEPWIIVDPTLVQGGNLWDVYVVPHRTPAAWSDDPVLVDVRGAPQTVLLSTWSVFFNRIVMSDGDELAPGTGLEFGAGYSVVGDRNRDGRLDNGDVIDGFARPGFAIVRDPSGPGPLDVATIDHSGGAFLGQRIVHPVSVEAPRPLVVICHGNFMQHTWYDDLMAHLASWGYVVMSHENDTMPGPESAARTTLDNTDYLLANLDTIGGGALDGMVDGHRIVWIGHSRGGEGIVHALHLLRAGKASRASFDADDVRLLVPIAPTAFLDPAASSAGDTPLHFLYGSADGDVFGNPDCEPCQAFRQYERATGLRSSAYLYGADHNDFNCCGPNDFEGPIGSEIGRDEAQRVMRASMLAAIDHAMTGGVPSRDFLARQQESLRVPGVALTTIVDRDYRDGAPTFVVDDFQSAPSTMESSSGGAVIVGVTDLAEGLLRDTDGLFTWSSADPFNGFTRCDETDEQRGAAFEWNGDASLEFEVVPGGRDLSAGGCLSFRIAQGPRHPWTLLEFSDIVFDVVLVDGAGTTSALRVGAAGSAEEPYPRMGYGAGAGWQSSLETVRLNLAEFPLVEDTLDLTDVRAIRFEFGPSHGSSAGRLAIDDIEIVGP